MPVDKPQHIALPLKYRPMTFEDVVGQAHVVRTLRHAIAANRVANAYLFIGSRGIGKTTLSRIFAKALNCSAPVGTEPCGKCENCVEIAEGRSLDVTELDAASHNKVEDVKPIIDAVQFKPVASHYKIFIVDECHMLSNAAWNALLKTLEEPPPYVRFIFATTEGDKVLPTIVSRCQRFDLRRIQTRDIAARLRYVCEKEGIQAEDDALLAIARGADGGMRDALSSLDQLIAFTDGHVTEKDALGVFGLVGRAELEALAGAILSGDTARILASVESFDSAGKNLRRLAGELLKHFRNLVVLQALGPETKSLEATPEQIAVLKRQAEGVDPGRVFRICDQLAEMEDKLRYALSVRTLIEMSLIRAGRIATTATVEELMRAVRALKGAGAPVPATTASLGQPAPEPEPAPTALPARKYAAHRLPDAAELASPAPAPKPAPAAAPQAPAAKPVSAPVPAAPPVPPAAHAPSVAPARRQEILDDPKLNALLTDLGGAEITDIREKGTR
ncbi:MAG TPA: DNA polymerase III subunit gamma/tau [Verrucomicrobia bacterium]|nr:DNA polymerase III subunit gamma/tau [Verrucomicrobiota bacterium]